MTNWLRSMFAGVGKRTTGRPTSANGASSLHLIWEVPSPERLIGAAVTLEVSDRPDIDDLVFMAMQVSFADPGGGGAHLGLQHHPGFPGRSAVNWGGYAPGGGLLSGSPSALASTPDDVNTRDFPWRAGVPYRLDITRGGQDGDGVWAWTGSVTGREGDRTVVRELYSRGSTLRDPIVWVESFAPCDAPSFAVRWSDASVVSVGGATIPVRSMRAAYQSPARGGCTNTTSDTDGPAFSQRTNTDRVTREGFRLSID